VVAAPLAASTTVWQPQPGPQTDLVTCPAFEVFFGGARGGGKTDGMLGEFASHAAKYGENASGLMVRRTRTELGDTIERSKVLYTPIGAKFHEQDKMWRFPNGARLRFAYLERDSDADAYQGHNYTRVYVEEAGTFPSPKPILKLMATLRSGAGVPVGIRLTGNPGGPGQQWVAARYINPAPEGYKIFQRTFDNPITGGTVTRDWVFIPSKLRDNKFLLQDPGYVAQLQMVGSEDLVKAWLEGDWTVVQGAFFSEWRLAKHVIKPFDIPDDWLRFRSMDWGSASPGSVGWWAVVGDDTVIGGSGPEPRLRDVEDGNGDARPGTRLLPRGCLVRYREWYIASGPGQGLKLTAEEVALQIKERERGEKIAYGVLDPSTFKEDGGPSIAERMAKLEVYFRPADNKRVSRGTHVGSGPMGGWDQMRARLKGDNEGNPMVVCFNDCLDSIRTIPALQHDTDRMEDLDTEAEDHCADEWRYACMSRPYIPNVTTEKKKVDTGYRQKKTAAKTDEWVSY
jgi:hypothetical protein